MIKLTKHEVEAVRSYLMEVDCPLPKGLSNAVCDLALKGLEPRAEIEPIITMALCEQGRVVLREGITYRFAPMAGCAECARFVLPPSMNSRSQT